MKLDKQIYNAIINYMAYQNVESGGIFGGQNGIITHFYPDRKAIPISHAYAPHIESLNQVISEWLQAGIYFLGFIHSHTKNGMLSEDDIAYCQAFFESNPTGTTVISALYVQSTNQISLYQIEQIHDKLMIQKIPYDVG